MVLVAPALSRLRRRRKRALMGDGNIPGVGPRRKSIRGDRLFRAPERPAEDRKGKSEEEAPWLNDPMTASTA